MARLPVTGADDGTWGDILNAYLQISLNTDGTLKDGVITLGKLATSNSASGGQLLKYDGTNLTWATLAKSDVGLGNVDNTTDLGKPISTATQNALNLKANASDVSAKVLLIDNASALPAGTPAGVVVVVKS
jgi:hypothetical protein